jgi:hypothetical protein
LGKGLKSKCAVFYGCLLRQTNVLRSSTSCLMAHLSLAGGMTAARLDSACGWKRR